MSSNCEQSFQKQLKMFFRFIWPQLPDETKIVSASRYEVGHRGLKIYYTLDLRIINVFQLK